MSDQLHSLLEGLSRSGDLDSEGQFTLSYEKAMEKLRSAGLREPSVFPVLLVSAATILGATHLTVNTGDGGQTVPFDGEPMPEQFWRTPYQCLLDGTSQDLTILRGRGDGSFLALPSPASGVRGTRLQTGDVNGDGIRDLVVLGERLSILLGRN